MIGRILEIQANNGGQITSARYLFSKTSNETTVQTEGNWFFDVENSRIPLDQITEEIVLKWIVDATTQNGINTIESRLDAQISSVAHPVALPWKTETFTVTL